MTSAPAATHAFALDIRQLDTGALLGVALVIPPGRYVSFIIEGTRIATTSLPDEMWRQIDAWVADGNARLPAKPAPLSPSIVAAILEGQPPAVSAQRFAAIPIPVAFQDDLARLAERLLPELLNARRSAA